MQAEVQCIADASTARALRQNVAFLTLFMEPRSPREIAASAGMAANLALHHARKLEGLGLLIEVIRIPSVSLTNRESAGSSAPRPEPVLLFLASTRILSFAKR